MGEQPLPPERTVQHLRTVQAIARSSLVDRYFIGYSGRNAWRRFCEHRRAGCSHLVVIADGVSTASAPDVASIVAAETAGERLLAFVEADDPEEAMRAALLDANRAVSDLEWMPDIGRSAPACTMVAAAWDGTAVTLGWIGDSRAYWLEGGSASLAFYYAIGSTQAEGRRS